MKQETEKKEKRLTLGADNTSGIWAKLKMARIKPSICALRFRVITVCGCLPSQGLELINGVKKERIFSDGSREVRYIREIIYGKKRALRYWEITTDIETLPENLTWYVMTLASGSLS